MTGGRSFWHSTSGAAASEFVLAMPMMLILIFVAMEAGNYFWNEQKLIQAVRDGARYAARQPINKICDPTSPDKTNPAFTGGSVETAIRNVVRTGQPDGSGQQRLPIWSEAKVAVTPRCQGFVSTGIYSSLGGAGAIVSVSVEGMPYYSILGALGFAPGSVALAASENAAVIGT